MPPPPRDPRNTPSPWAKEGLGGWALWPLFRCKKGARGSRRGSEGAAEPPQRPGPPMGPLSLPKQRGRSKKPGFPGFFVHFYSRLQHLPPLEQAVEKVACATFFEVFIAPLRLRRGQGAMQRNPCYARLFADLPYTPPNPIIASGGQSRAPPVAGGARRKPSEQGSARKAPRADAARPLRTALRPPNPQGFFDRLEKAFYS